MKTQIELSSSDFKIFQCLSRDERRKHIKKNNCFNKGRFGFLNPIEVVEKK